ncbi:MAG: hypothetical protein ACK5QH_14375 [Rubrivivax sp.]
MKPFTPRAWRLALACSTLVAGSLWGVNLGAQSTTLPEVKVSSAAIPDFEFDWGRDGQHCATCNFGQGNARFAFSDGENRLWLGYIDHQTGAFLPANGQAVLLDSNAARATDFGNGPEWTYGANGSQVMYTKYLAGRPKNSANAGLGLATQVNGSWTAGFVPGSLQRQSPAGSLDLTDTEPRFHYISDRDNQVYWRSTAAIEVERPLPIADGGNGIARRWVPGTRKVIYAAKALGADGVEHDQIFTYDTDSGKKEQLTFEATDKLGAFMWRAPEFGNDWVFFTVADRTTLLVYRRLPGADGALRWTVVKSVVMPTALPYVWSPEQFVHNGRSYIFFQLSSSPVFNDTSIPNQLAITGIDPRRVNFRMLTNDSANPRARIDPEYYITAQGPYIYYTRLLLSTATRPPINDGVWRVDTGLGPAQATTP